MTFFLSMGLFSSFDIDAGTRLLLKTLAKKAALSQVSSAVDTGCGTGVIGISLKKKYPGMAMLFQDRDALAAAYTRENCRINGVDPDKVEEALLLEGLEPASQDLIVSNIPAKAGEKVLKDFFSYAGSFLKEGGRIAVVIVDPLKEAAQEALDKAGCRILHKESTKMHTVFHFDGGLPFPGEDFTRYIRHSDEFDLTEETYFLETVYNLPDFDQLSYATRIAGELLRHTSFSGKALFWNAGQGHIPVWMARRPSNHLKEIHLASRDILQNRITGYNLKKAGYQGEVVSHQLPGEPWLKSLAEEEQFQFIYFSLDPITRVKWQDSFAETLDAILQKGKYCYINGRSSDLSLLVKQLYGYHFREDNRFKGNRGILLQKK